MYNRLHSLSQPPVYISLNLRFSAPKFFRKIKLNTSGNLDGNGLSLQSKYNLWKC